MTHFQLEEPDFHFIAFLDILGFSNMVKSDFESPFQNKTFFTKLFKIYNYTSSLHESSMGLSIIQFSDSIVLSVPFSEDVFSQFLSVIATYQYDLFREGIICRGGIAYGKHFLQESFLFSNGLIEAYRIESEIARYPRIVVSTDLIDLIYKNGETDKNIPLIKENDGLFFVDFLKDMDLVESSTYLKLILDSNKSSNVSVKEKHRWLTEYFDYKVSESDCPVARFGQPRFSRSKGT